MITYQDTIVSSITVTDTVDTFTYTTQQLLPGLNFGSTTVGRQRIVIPRSIFAEVLPVGSSTATAVLQLQVPPSWAGNRSSEGFGFQPFKLISLVNPTILNMDWKAAGRTVPYILRPTSMLDNEEMLDVQGRTGGTTSRALQLRITTVVDIMPQDGIVNIVPSLRSRFVSSCSPGQDGGEECDEVMVAVPNTGLEKRSHGSDHPSLSV